MKFKANNCPDFGLLTHYARIAEFRREFNFKMDSFIAITCENYAIVFIILIHTHTNTKFCLGCAYCLRINVRRRRRKKGFLASAHLTFAEPFFSKRTKFEILNNSYKPNQYRPTFSSSECRKYRISNGIISFIYSLSDQLVRFALIFLNFLVNKHK